MAEEIASKVVMVAPRRASIRTKKCKGVSNAFASHGKRNWQKKVKQRKTKTITHTPCVGRERKRKGYRVSDTKESQTSKKVKLCMYFVQ